MIVAELKVKNGMATVVGLTKANLELLVRQEVVLVHVPGMGAIVLVYADNDATLEASVNLAHNMLMADCGPSQAPS